MNLIELGIRFDGEMQTRYTNDQKPVHEVMAEFAYTDRGELKYAPIKLVRFGEKPLEEGIVSGQFRTDKYEDRDGNKKYSYSVIVDNITPTTALIPFNNIALVGGCGRDPEIKYFESGASLAEVSFAVNRYKADEPDWLNLQFWGKTAQTVADYVRKGSKLAVYGQLYFQTWTDRSTGQTRYKPMVNCQRFEFVGSKKDQEESDGNYNAPSRVPQTSAVSSNTAYQSNVAEFDDSEIPF